MDELKRAKILYDKYLNRTATPEELDELFNLLRDRSRFEELNNLMENEWNSNDVSFTMKNIPWENIETGYKPQNSKSPSHKKSKTIWISAYGKIAAAAIVILIGFAIWWFNNPGIEVFTTGYGETMEIVLDDQSKIILNANSSLTWQTDWQSAKERTAILEGEAYFEVSHQHMIHPTPSSQQATTSGRMPFRVITPDLTVNVLGTSFNVMTRRQKTDVLLESGKVLLTRNMENDGSKSFDVKESSGPNQGIQDSMILLPGDYVSYSAKTQSVDRSETTPSPDLTSWTEGFLTYRGIKLNTVLQELEDIYGKSFVVEDSALLERIVNLGLPYEDWQTVSGLMTLSLEIEMSEKGEQITIKKKQGK